MGYMFATAECINCSGLFMFNPERVPSVVVNGRREPICRACVDYINPLREARGLLRIHVLPGAYETCNESDL